MATRVTAGRALSASVVLVLLADAAIGLFAPDKLAAALAETGYDAKLVAPIALLALVGALIYAVPRTAMLGAILITAFCGGAIASHFRIGEVASPPQLVCLGIALAAWGGLYLRFAGVRALLPTTR